MASTNNPAVLHIRCQTRRPFFWDPFCRFAQAPARLAAAGTGTAGHDPVPSAVAVADRRRPSAIRRAVGRRSRSAVVPRSPETGPRPGDRPPPVTGLVSRPSSYPAARPGMTYRDERNVRW